MYSQSNKHNTEYHGMTQLILQQPSAAAV